eukprot:scpid98255/ scgid32963/ 
MICINIKTSLNSQGHVYCEQEDDMGVNGDVHARKVIALGGLVGGMVGAALPLGPGLQQPCPDQWNPNGEGSMSHEHYLGCDVHECWLVCCSVDTMMGMSTQQLS